MKTKTGGKLALLFFIAGLAMFIPGNVFAQIQGPTFKIKKTVSASALAGKTVVFFNTVMAGRQYANSSDQQGFIMSSIHIGNWNKKAKAFDEELASIQNQKLPELDQAVREAFQLFDTVTVGVPYDFGEKVPPPITFFNKPDAKMKKQIADACEANGAEYAVAIIQRISHGQAQSISGAALTWINGSIYVFNKAGAIVAQAETSLPGFSGMYGLAVQPDVAPQYVDLIDNARENLVALLPSLVK
jgi:hypothetical protein